MYAMLNSKCYKASVHGIRFFCKKLRRQVIKVSNVSDVEHTDI